jgi:hypothetical protein
MTDAPTPVPIRSKLNHGPEFDPIKPFQEMITRMTYGQLMGVAQGLIDTASFNDHDGDLPDQVVREVFTADTKKERLAALLHEWAVAGTDQDSRQ